MIHATADTIYEQFLFEAGRPGGLAVDGLDACAAAVRQHNADALVIVDRHAAGDLPAAARAVGAEVIVTTDPVPLADGVGVLLSHP
jgi:hypothetical protein